MSLAGPVARASPGSQLQAVMAVTTAEWSPLVRCADRIPGSSAHRCHKREMFLQLEDGSYTTTMTEVSLRDELEGMMGPRAQVTADDVVSLDRTVMRLLVQEVADNATKYSPPGSTIRVNASLQAGVKALLEACRETASEFLVVLASARATRLRSSSGVSTGQGMEGFDGGRGGGGLGVAIAASRPQLPLACCDQRKLDIQYTWRSAT